LVHVARATKSPSGLSRTLAKRAMPDMTAARSGAAVPVIASSTSRPSSMSVPTVKDVAKGIPAPAVLSVRLSVLRAGAVIEQRGTLQSTDTVLVPHVLVVPERRTSRVDMAPVSSCTPSKRTVAPLTVVLPTLRPLTRSSRREPTGALVAICTP
jgi:hypothetical protein